MKEIMLHLSLISERDYDYSEIDGINSIHWTDCNGKSNSVHYNPETSLTTHVYVSETDEIVRENLPISITKQQLIQYVIKK